MPTSLLFLLQGINFVLFFSEKISPVLPISSGTKSTLGTQSHVCNLKETAYQEKRQCNSQLFVSLCAKNPRIQKQIFSTVSQVACSVMLITVAIHVVG